MSHRFQLNKWCKKERKKGTRFWRDREKREEGKKRCRGRDRYPDILAHAWNQCLLAPLRAGHHIAAGRITRNLRKSWIIALASCRVRWNDSMNECKRILIIIYLQVYNYSVYTDILQTCLSRLISMALDGHFIRSFGKKIIRLWKQRHSIMTKFVNFIIVKPWSIIGMYSCMVKSKNFLASCRNKCILSKLMESFFISRMSRVSDWIILERSVKVWVNCVLIFFQNGIIYIEE